MNLSDCKHYHFNSNEGLTGASYNVYLRHMIYLPLSSSFLFRSAITVGFLLVPLLITCLSSAGQTGV